MANPPQNPTMRPVHRPGKPFPPIMPPGSAGGVGVVKNPPQQSVSNSYSHNQLPKREITFPPDSVEATMPVLYRRKRICRSDLGPVDAWRIIMCLRSGLLSETTYALDMLNVLLFDDTSVSYFGLNQWPGLLELLMEHFRKCLADMFDNNDDDKMKTGSSSSASTSSDFIDLGGIVQPIDPNLKNVILTNTNNYTLMSRKGNPVKLIDKNDDIFVQDNLKDWDYKGDVNRKNTLATIPTDPWYTTAEHILPTFQAEFGNIPFHMRLDDDLNYNKNKNLLNMKRRKIELDDRRTTTSLPPPPPDETPPPIKPSTSSDKKRRTLSDVISRIKKDSSSSSTSSSSSDGNEITTATTTTTTNVLTDKIKTELVVVSENANCSENNTDIEHEQQQQSNIIDLNNISNTNNSSVKVIKCGHIIEQQKEQSAVRDPAGTLKRRRISDYEDESYTRDEASLVLLTESQDNIGKRCVCLSNILRSLTFVPGNEIEFARSQTFLALVGKLLLLHHEHPPRTQKTRNYDREVNILIILHTIYICMYACI